MRLRSHAEKAQNASVVTFKDIGPFPKETLQTEPCNIFVIGKFGQAGQSDSGRLVERLERGQQCDLAWMKKTIEGGEGIWGPTFCQGVDPDVVNALLLRGPACNSI